MIKDDLMAGFYLTRGFEGSLLLYPKAEWDLKSSLVASLPSNQEEARKFQRLFLAKAHFMTLDRQNRFLIPESHCTRLGITKGSREVVFVGVGRHVEIWKREKYAEYEKYIESEYEKLAETVFSPSEERARTDANPTNQKE